MAEFLNSNVKHLRIDKNMSQQSLADEIGVDRSTISRIENGEIDTTIENAIKLADALDISLNDLVSLDLRFDNGSYISINSNTTQIPVLGVIKAGTPIEAQENVLEYVDIPTEWLKSNKKYYGLKIKGNSMVPKYSPNDIVIFEQTDDMLYANNKECCVMVNGYDATFKKFNLREDGITLTPLNLDNDDGYLPTTYTKEQIESLPVKVIGVAKRRITDY